MEISYFSFQIGVNTFTYSYFIVRFFFDLAWDTQKIVYTQTKASVSGTVKPSLYKKFNLISSKVRCLANLDGTYNL